MCCVTPPASARPKGGRDVAVQVCFWCESYVWLLLKTATCLWLPVYPALSVSPACVWDMCSTLLVVKPVNGKAAAASEPGQGAQVPQAQGKSLFNE